jgi:phospholipid/cholesterol/gamma-HCH transport system substrate-binding protein
MVKGLRSTAVKFTIFALVSAMSFLLIYNTMQDRVSGDLVGYRAMFSNVSGLRVGDNVRVAGVQVGKVTSVEVDGRDAMVGFTLKKAQPLLTTTRLVMRYQNLLGQRYIALEQDGQRGPTVKAGSTVGLDHTDPGFDLTALLNGFRPLFRVLQPADVNRLATTLVQTLQGEGGTIDQLFQQTTRLTNFLADRDQVFDQVLRNLTPVLHDLAGQGTEIRTTVDQLTSLMTGLARQRVTIGDSISEIARLINQTSDFLVQARAPSIALVRSLRNTAGMFAANLEAVKGAIQGFPQILGALGRLTSYQNAGNVYICKLRFSYQGAGIDIPPTDGPYSKVCGG